MIPKAITAEERPIYEKYLQDAEGAYHRLISGVSEVSVSYNGESVTYRPASKAELKNYIGQLRRVLGKSPLSNPGLVFKSVSFGSRASRGSRGGLY